MLNTLYKVEDHENHVRWIYLIFILHGGKSEVCEIDQSNGEHRANFAV